MAQKILGIDIGTYSVKAVRLKSRLGGGYEFIDSYCEPIDLGAENRMDSTVQAVSKIIRENKLEDDTVVSALSARKISGRFFKLPFTDRKKIDQVIDYEIENYIPFSSEDVVTDYQLISKEKDGANLFVQTAKRNDVDYLLNVFEKAGLELKYIDSEVMTLYSAFSYAFNDENCRAVIDMGHSKTLFAVVNKGKIAYSHSIDFGGRYINEKIADTLNVSLEEADELKKAFDRPKEVDDVIYNCLREFADILKRSIISFEMLCKEALDEIMFTGGSSNMSGAGNTLQEFLDIRFRKITLTDILEKGLDKDVDNASIIAYGIALRSKNSPSLSTIDFRSDKSSSSKELKYVFSSLVKVFVMALILLAFYKVDLLIKKQAKEAALKSYEEKIRISFNEALPNATSRGNELLIIKDKIKEAELQAERVGALLSKEVTALDMLKELSIKISKAASGEDVEIYECAFDGKRLNILGETKSYNLTDEIKKSLEGSVMFKEVKMEYAKFTADQKKVKFSMKIGLKQKGE
jgi:type IV pilus assembly protein PilM